MAFAILIGALAGVVGFIPLFVAMRLSRKSISTNVLGTATYGLVGVFVSMIVLAVEIIICSRVASEWVLPFGLSEMLTLIIATAMYVIYKNVLAKRKNR